ncbi:acetyltransferase [Pseudomonas sp. DCB_BI]|uniref:acetyltransferase n=1 Tax=Pseudomonas sp. DCB_BI TaxID=2993594 RepID=UPI00224A66B3|nr:acetyltransferase [Pseudomonas sp. DCB_BI]MCX2889747.1 acetyltransferase [Pseudomonas sp. DCB_BI]
MKRLAILGASGHGKVVADTAEVCGWTEVLFFDDAWPSRTSNGVWDVVGTGQDLLGNAQAFDGVVVAIGNNLIRQAKLAALVQQGATLATLVHPLAYVSRHAKIGAGSVVFAGAVLNAGASVGVGGILNTGCSVDHDCFLADSVHVSPGARLAGGVTIGQCSWVGIGACVKQLINIGPNVVVGAGAAVVSDVGEGMTVIGVPARALE